MNRLALVLAAALLGGTANAVDWNPYANMSRAEVAWQTAHLIDVAQTIEITKDPYYSEANVVTAQLIGQCPKLNDVLAWGIATSYLHATLGGMMDRSDRLPRWSKALIRSIDFAYKANAVTGNFQIGIRIGATNKPLTNERGRCQ